MIIYSDVTLLVCPDLAESEVHALLAAAWPQHDPERDFVAVVMRSPVYIYAYADERLVGFVYVAWDGGVHGFLLYPTVHLDWQHRGVGTALVRRAVEECRARGLLWLHVDYEASLAPFYEASGFVPPLLGLFD